MSDINWQARAEVAEAEVERLLLKLAEETYREEGGRIVVGKLMAERRRAEAAEAALARVKDTVRNSLTSLAESWEGEADYGYELGHSGAAHATRICATALRHALSEGGCCDACDGDGYTFGGEPCWDCRGTGHPHPEDDLRAALAAEPTPVAEPHAQEGAPLDVCLPSLGYSCGQCHRCTPAPVADPSGNNPRP